MTSTSTMARVVRTMRRRGSRSSRPSVRRGPAVSVAPARLDIHALRFVVRRDEAAGPADPQPLALFGSVLPYATSSSVLVSVKTGFADGSRKPTFGTSYTPIVTDVAQ